MQAEGNLKTKIPVQYRKFRVMCWRRRIVGIAGAFLWLIAPTAYAQALHLQLVWRQQFQSMPANFASIFFKPASIPGSFVVRGVLEGNQLLVFDQSGQLVQTTPAGGVSAFYSSPTRTVFVLDELQPAALSPSIDEGPTSVSAMSNGTQIWQRQTDFEDETIVADSGLSVDLDHAIAVLTFYDKQGNPVRQVQPFGKPLPWSDERSAFGAFSQDSSVFAFLATTPLAQGVALFLYDNTGNALLSTTVQGLQVAEGLGLSPNGNSALLVGWTQNPASNAAAQLVGMVSDSQGRIVQPFAVPSIGEQVQISVDSSTGDFVLDTGSGTIIRVSATSPASIFSLGGVFNATAVASNGGLTAWVSLEPVGSQLNQTNLVLRIVSQTGILLLQRTLGGNTLNLDTPNVWLSQDGKFVAVRFSDEIRYYEFSR